MSERRHDLTGVFRSLLLDGWGEVTDTQTEAQTGETSLARRDFWVTRD